MGVLHVRFEGMRRRLSNVAGVSEQDAECGSIISYARPTLSLVFSLFLPQFLANSQVRGSVLILWVGAMAKSQTIREKPPARLLGTPNKP
jgi:hypothetical protein